MVETISLNNFDFENTTVNLYMVSFGIDLNTGSKSEEIITVDGLKIDTSRLTSDLSNVPVKDIRLYIADYHDGMKKIAPAMIEPDKKIGYYYLKNWVTDEVNATFMSGVNRLNCTFFVNSLVTGYSIEDTKVKVNKYLQTLSENLAKASKE